MKVVIVRAAPEEIKRLIGAGSPESGRWWSFRPSS